MFDISIQLFFVILFNDVQKNGKTHFNRKQNINLELTKTCIVGNTVVYRVTFLMSFMQIGGAFADLI